MKISDKTEDNFGNFKNILEKFLDKIEEIFGNFEKF